MSQLRLLSVLMPILVAGVCGPAAAQPQSLPEIRAAASRFLEARAPSADGRIEIQVGRLDARLRLPGCGARLEPFAVGENRTGGNVTVGVRCPQGQSWTVYVPAVVRHFKPVAVAARTLTRGAVLAAADIRFEERDVNRSLGTGHFLDLPGLLGMQLRRSVTAGTTFSPAALAAPKVVNRGARVVLVASGQGIEIRSAGEALADAAAGERVRVRNSRSKRVVEGVVINAGLVQVPL